MIYDNKNGILVKTENMFDFEKSGIIRQINRAYDKDKSSILHEIFGVNLKKFYLIKNGQYTSEAYMGGDNPPANRYMYDRSGAKYYHSTPYYEDGYMVYPIQSGSGSSYLDYLIFNSVPTIVQKVKEKYGVYPYVDFTLILSANEYMFSNGYGLRGSQRTEITISSKNISGMSRSTYYTLMIKRYAYSSLSSGTCKIKNVYYHLD